MTITNPNIPYHETSNVSFKAQGAVVGKTFLAIAADRTGGPALSADLMNVYVMKTCPAAATPVGVAKYDVATGELGGSYGQPGMVLPVTAGAVIAAGAEVEVGAAGKAIPLAAGKAAGMCLSGAVLNGDAIIKLY